MKSVKTAQGNFTVLQALARILTVARDDKRGTGNNDSETASHYRKESDWPFRVGGLGITR